MLLRGGAHDLVPAEVLHAAVVVQGQDRGQRTPGARGLEKHRLGGGTVGQLPRELFDLQILEAVAAADLDPQRGSRRPGSRRQRPEKLPQLCPPGMPPGLDVLAV